MDRTNPCEGLDRGSIPRRRTSSKPTHLVGSPTNSRRLWSGCTSEWIG